jgi:hypothetical protein
MKTKNKISILFAVLSICSPSFGSYIHQEIEMFEVKSVAKLTEYSIKEKGKLKFDRLQFEIGHSNVSGPRKLNLSETTVLNLKSQMSVEDRIEKMKLTLEDQAGVQVANQDEKKVSEKICTENKNERVCHVSIELLLTVSPKLRVSSN